MENGDWLWTDCPGQLLWDRRLAECLAHTPRGLLKRDVEGFFLALPYAEDRPFPIPPLFCLSKLACLSGRWYAVFRFTRQGRPELFQEDV